MTTVRIEGLRASQPPAEGLWPRLNRMTESAGFATRTGSLIITTAASRDDVEDALDAGGDWRDDYRLVDIAADGSTDTTH